jgi:hypothetical protein
LAKLKDTIDEREETPYMDDEEQGETPSEWTVVKTRKSDRCGQKRQISAEKRAGRDATVELQVRSGS